MKNGVLALHASRPRSNTRILVLSHYDAVRLYGWEVIVLPDDRTLVIERYTSCKALASNDRELLVDFFKTLYPSKGEYYEDKLRGLLPGIIGFPVIATCSEMYHSEFMLVRDASPIASLSYTSSGEGLDEASEVTVYDARRLTIGIGMGTAVVNEAYYLEDDNCVQVDSRLGVGSGTCPYEVYLLTRILSSSGKGFKSRG